MPNIVELIINTPANAYLDMDPKFDIAIEYSIDDVKNITLRNSALSKTITLPGSKNNNYWFGNLFDVNSDFSKFNPNKKLDARIVVNGEMIMDGFLQLLNIRKVNTTDGEGNGIEYDTIMFDRSVDLITELGDKTINEIDLVKYNHDFTPDNVIDSWTHTWQDGYVYPMFGTADKDSFYNITDFSPAIFYRTLLDGLFRDAGYGWTGSLASNTQFNKEILSKCYNWSCFNTLYYFRKYKIVFVEILENIFQNVYV